MRQLKLSRILDATPTDVWERLVAPATVLFICRGLIGFRRLDDALPDQWAAGESYAFRLHLFGLIPLPGIHRITVLRIDSSDMVLSSQESSALIRVWNHDITLKAAKDGQTQYTDIVDIDAGLFTWPVFLFACLLFRWRQRRWGLLIR